MLKKEKLMPELRIYHWSPMTMLFRTGADLLGLVEVLRQHGAHIVVCDITELGE